MEGRKKVRIITDGACLGNPGPGGWAAILRHGPHTRELYGSAKHTTNNRMELAAAIEGLRALREPCEVEVTTDSEYLKNGITRWIRGWKRNGWVTATKSPVLNRDLWMALDELASKHKTDWRWTKGHASDADNNRADELASKAARNQVSSRGWKPDPALCYELNGRGAAPPREKVNLAAAFAQVVEHWQPEVIGSINDVQVKLVKLLGDFVWHKHAEEDEMFLVVSGSLVMRFRDREVRLDKGEFLIVPRGVEHKPFAEAECHVMLIEPKSTVRTGN